MRRRVGMKFAGLAFALAGVAVTDNAEAGDANIVTATNNPLQTSAPLAPGDLTPGDITIGTGGSITVTAGQSATTLNSPNTDITNNNTATTGGLLSSNADNTTAIRIIGGNSGNVLNAGNIALTDGYTIADGDNDGDADGAWAQGTGRYGILLTPGGHTGNITTSGAITIEGNNSGAIRLESLLTGNVLSSSNIILDGDNNIAIAVAGGGVNGDVVVDSGLISVRGANSAGVVVDAQVTGALSIRGSIAVTGFHATTRPADLTRLDADDFLLSRSGVEVHASVGDGIIIQGVGVEDDIDDDGDGIHENTDTNDDALGALTVFSSAPALLVQSLPGVNISLGTTGSGGGIWNRGLITANGVYDGNNATGVRVAGTATSTVTTSGGIYNDNGITANSFEGNAAAISIGLNATAPTITNRAVLTASVASDDPFEASGINIGAGATVPSITNTGTITALAFGETANARGIVDLSNTLAQITNTGTIRTSTTPTDDDPTDNVVPVATGVNAAIDVSASSIAVTLNQSPDVPFSDDDGVDGDASTRPPPTILGDVLFGSGSDVFNLATGVMGGNIAFNGGNDAFNISGGGAFTGRVTDTNNNLVLSVGDGEFNLAGGTVNIATATFGADSTLGVVLTTDADTARIVSSGTITFVNGAFVNAIIPTGLPEIGQTIFLTATGGLVGGNLVERDLSGGTTPFIYNMEIAIATSDVNSLEVRYQLKDETALGLTGNQAIAYDPIIVALRNDPEAADAFASLTTQAAFDEAYEDLLPSFSAGATELATMAIQQSQSAATNRLATTRLRDVDHTSVWVQEIGYGLVREPIGAGVEFRGFGFGIAGGIDAPLNSGALLGISAAVVTSQVEEPFRPDGEVAATFGQLNAYLGTAAGPVDLDFVGGLGVGRMSSRRVIEIGPLFTQVSEADWWAYEGHAAARASVPMRLSDSFFITPQAALTYAALNETGYTEEGGGAGLDFDVDSTMTQRLWADAGVEFSARRRLRGQGMVAGRLFLGYRANVLEDAEDRTFRSVSGGQDFTFTDETSGSGAPLVGIGIDATNGYSTFSIGYEGELGDEIDRHSLNASLRFRF